MATATDCAAWLGRTVRESFLPRHGAGENVMGKTRALISTWAFGVMLLGSSALAASKPANATAQCADGTYSAAKTTQGACSKHGGVKTWIGSAPATPAAATKIKPAPVAVPRDATA